MKNKILVIVVLGCLLNSVSAFSETIVNPRFAGKRCAQADLAAQQLGVVLPVLQRAGIEYKVVRNSGGMSVIARGVNITRGSISSLLQNQLFLDLGVQFQATTAFPEPCTHFESLRDDAAI